MIPQALYVPQSNPPPSIPPFLTAFSIVILIFISIIIFSVLASFAIIIFIYIIFQYLICPTNFDEVHQFDLEVGERNEHEITRARVLVSHQIRHGVERSERNVWREVLERTMAERKRLRGQALEKMATPVRYGSFEPLVKCIDCAICLEDFDIGELCQIFPVCNHIFHYSCIQHWLKKNMTCPICRYSIVNENC